MPQQLKRGLHWCFYIIWFHFNGSGGITMKVVCTEYLIKSNFEQLESVWKELLTEIKDAVTNVVWPPGNDKFVFNSSATGRGRGEGNGVKPIKQLFCANLKNLGWELETRMNLGSRRVPGPIDAIKRTSVGVFAVEWETGNISSSHRAINKMVYGILTGEIVGGALLLPTREMYRYLTDRVGNFEELEPYFPVWKAVNVQKSAVLAVIAVEHDGTSPSVPRIPKGTDGRALV